MLDPQTQQQGKQGSHAHAYHMQLIILGLHFTILLLEGVEPMFDVHRHQIFWLSTVPRKIEPMRLNPGFFQDTMQTT